MFADDTNLFYLSKNIKPSFETMSFKLIKISEWLKTNKLSINIKRANFILFNSCRANENLPLKLPLLFLDGFEIKQASSVKFLGVQINENLGTNYLNTPYPSAPVGIQFCTGD